MSLAGFRLMASAIWSLVAAVVVAAVSTGCSNVRSSSVPEVRGVRDESVTFPSGGATLSGTLFLPASGDRHPAVVLFHGSGPQPRNPFMARWFAEHGVAALTYDKRGVGASTGDFRTVAFTDLAADGLAAIALLKARPDIDCETDWGVGFEPGWMAGSAGRFAVKRHCVRHRRLWTRRVTWRADDLLLRQPAARSRVQRRGGERGGRDEKAAVASVLDRRWLRRRGARALDDARSRPWFAAVNEQSDGLLSRPAKELLNDPALRSRQWYRSEVNYDPRIALRALSVPALFIFGDRDALVPVEPSVAIIRQTLTDAGHRAFSIVVFPGADHGMFVSAAEGGRTLAPGYLDAIEGWLRTTLRR